MTPHFTDSELACKCGCGLLPPQPLQDRLERVRVRYGKPMAVSSGARCAKHNQAVSSTGPNGPHTKGAVDVAVAGADALEVVRIMIAEGFTGIGVAQKGEYGKRFIHGDILLDAPGQPRPWIWSY